MLTCATSFKKIVFLHKTLFKDGQKQLQFAQSERNKVQSAYDALKKQWEEHFTSCGKGTKVSKPCELVKVRTQAS